MRRLKKWIELIAAIVTILGFAWAVAQALQLI